MNPNLKRHLFLIFVSLWSIYFSACKPDEPCEGLDTTNQKTYYYFPDSTASQNGMLAHPFDTLTFVSETFDTAIFVLTKVNNFFDQTFKKKYGNPGCPGMIYDYYEYFELVYTKMNHNHTRLRLKFRLTQTEIVSTALRLYYINDNNETQMGSRHLVIAKNDADTVIQLGNNLINAVQYGDAETESEYGFYNLQFGLLLFKYDNVIWRRIFRINMPLEK